MTGARAASVLAALVAASAAAIVWPVLWTPLSGDDAFNSYLEGWKLAHHASLFDTFRAEFLEWDVGRGRFIPILQLLNVVQFHVFQEAFPLKVMQVAAIAVDVALLFGVVLELDGSSRVATAAALVAVLTLQSRSWYDAIAQYNLHLPIGTALALTALLFAARFRRLGSRRDYAFAVVSFGLATLTYEIFVPLIVPVGYLVFGNGKRRSSWLRVVAPFASVLAVEFAIVAGIRHAFPQLPGGPYSPNVFSKGYLSAALLQLIGALPFDYIFVDPQSIFCNNPGWWHHPAVSAAFAALVASAAVALALWVRADASPKANAGEALLLSGLALAFGPPLLVASSPFYQRLIEPGLPYIPVYAQGFGIALLVAPLLGRLRAPTGLVVGAPCILAAALSCYLVGSASELAMRGFYPWGFARDTIVLGLARDPATAAAGSLVFLDDSYIVNDRFEVGSLWNNVWFYRLFGGRMWRTQPLASERSYKYDEATELRSVANTQAHGAFLSQRVRSTIHGVAVLQYASIVERSVGAGTRPYLVGSAFRAADFELTGSGNGWASYRFMPLCTELPTSALVDNSPSLTTIAYGDGFYGREQDGDRAFRWAGRDSSLILRNWSPMAVVTRLGVTVQTAGRARGALFITETGRRVTDVSLSSTAAKLETTVRIPPGSSVALTIHANAPNVALPGDSRDVRVKISDASLVDSTGCAVADAARRGAPGELPN